MLRRLGAEAVEVRKPEQLDGLDGLVIPGGESTTFMRLMQLYGLDEAIRGFDRPVFGTCAGMIVLDRNHLGLVDLAVRRNAFGRQVASFETDLDVAGEDEPVRAVFIRAPWVEEVGPERRGARRGRRPAGARARGAVPRRRVPSGADRRHAAARTVPGARQGGAALSGHSKWSSIKHKKGAADAKRGKLFSKLSRGDHRRGEGGRGRPGQQPRAAERDREGEVVLDAEGQHRPRDREGLGRGRRRRTRSRRSSTRATAPRASR